MKSRIFTERERMIIKSFVDGKIPINDPKLTRIRTRIREPELFADANLLFSLRDKVEASMAEMKLRKRGLD